MGNSSSFCGEQQQKQQNSREKNNEKQRRINSVEVIVKLDNKKLNYQSLLQVCQDNLNDWFECLHESALVSQNVIHSNCTTEWLSQIDEANQDNRASIEEIHHLNEINEYQNNYPYCNDILDVIIINFYILKKKEFILKLIQGPPKQRVRWSCWQLMAYTPKHNLCLQNISLLNENIQDNIAIKKDTERTMTAKNINYFENGDGKAHLQKVLIKLSKLFPQLGYCQGMNFLVGFTLIINNQCVDESLAFIAQMLVNPKYLLYYVYSEKMALVKLLEYICNEELYNNLPELYNKIIIEMDVKNAFWITKIIMTLFLYNFTLTTVCRFWDLILATSIFQIVSIICAFIEINSNIILKMEDTNDFISWFDSFQNNEIDQDQVNKIIKQSLKFKLNNYKITQYAQQFCMMNNERLPIIEVIALDIKNQDQLQKFINQDAFHH